jgi:hypothetical protein
LLYYLCLFKWILDSISEFNEGNGYQNKIILKHIVLGYKVDDKTISCNNSCQQL